MTTTELTTMFLPVEKAPAEEVRRQALKLTKAAEAFKVFDGMLNFCLILNHQRQAVFLNRSFREFLAEHGVEDPVGMRPGNMFGCAHAGETEGGCGTTISCRRCGAAMALGEALRDQEAIKECRILSKKSGEDLDLRVSVQPFNYDGEKFLLMSVMDISAEKRRSALERLLYQEIFSVAGGVRGLIDLLLSSGSAEDGDGYAKDAAAAADRLLEQVSLQKDLDAAERGELLLTITDVSALELLTQITGIMNASEAAKGKELEVHGASEDVKIFTDRGLLSRVLGSLIKNALEAESERSKITLACGKAENGAVFMVRNPACMPEEACVQVFQRSFSTKGRGRGLGTYSARLFTEKYLKGKLSFNTGPSGTEFRAEYPADI